MDFQLAGVTTMTSLEIADLTGKDHFHVVRDIETMFSQLEIDAKGYLQNWRHPQNQQEYKGYALSEELTLTLVSGYSAKLRLRIIERWKELESTASRSKFSVPTTLSGALRLAAEQAEVIEQQALQLEAAKPAVEFVDRYCDATGALGFRQVAKVLKVKEHVFRDFLIEKKIMYRLGGALAPMAAHLDAGRFVVKAGHAASNNHAFNSARFTPKGVNWVAGEFAKHQVEQQLALH